MNTTIEVPRRAAVMSPRRVIAICGQCGGAHDPNDTGEWDVCADCFGEAVDRAIAAHPAKGVRR
jgi:NADH pyrophosphatase NudC (nudix superfamily)